MDAQINTFNQLIAGLLSLVSWLARDFQTSLHLRVYNSSKTL